MLELPPVDLFNPAFKADPYPTYARLREEDPVHLTSLPDGRALWLVTRYDDGAAILRDSRFVKDWRTVGVQHIADNSVTRLLSTHMLNMDPPAHERLRGLVTKAFTPRLVEGLRGRIQSIADELLDAVKHRGQMDLINDYAFPLPIMVITEMMGVPSADRDKIRAWSNEVVTGVPSPERSERLTRILGPFIDYLRAMFEERRKSPTSDLLSELLHAEEEGGGKLSEEELFAMVFLLLVAGHETTVNLIGNGMLALLEHPAALARLRADPSLIRTAVEELLRYDGPVEMSTFRFAAEDVELCGKTIPKGASVLVSLTSSNRDGAQFPSPDVLDIARDPNRHIAFGLGIHYCLGAPLARIEGQIAITTLLAQMPDLHLLTPKSLTYRPGLILRGLVDLPVAF